VTIGKTEQGWFQSQYRKASAKEGKGDNTEKKRSGKKKSTGEKIVDNWRDAILW